ncbi:MAG: Crp/Fnr family transcriptional regulator [Burkholderiales bacterium]
MMVFDTGSGSLHYRAPPVMSANENVRSNAANAEVPMHGTNRVPVANNLLAALPRKEYRHLIDDMEQVALTYGQVLYEPGEQIKHVHFPNNSVVSLLTLVDRHQALEVGLVGREGMVGIPLALEITISPVRALVQGNGTAMRMKAAPFLKQLRQSQALQRELHRYTYSLMTQITQTAACNRFHVIEARLARWLLMTHDRMQLSPFRLTQDFLAQMLGVRRVGVTKAARALQLNKLISYSRGSITILDRKGLETACCSCYEIVKNMHGAA